MFASTFYAGTTRRVSSQTAFPGDTSQVPQYRPGIQDSILEPEREKLEMKDVYSIQGEHIFP
jgi:hypothetical protein